MATKFNKIINTPRHVVEWRINQRFKDHLRPLHQGTDYLRYLSLKRWFTPDSSTWRGRWPESILWSSSCVFGCQKNL